MWNAESFTSQCFCCPMFQMIVIVALFATCFMYVMWQQVMSCLFRCKCYGDKNRTWWFYWISFCTWWNISWTATCCTSSQLVTNLLVYITVTVNTSSFISCMYRMRQKSNLCHILQILSNCLELFDKTLQLYYMFISTYSDEILFNYSWNVNLMWIWCG